MDIRFNKNNSTALAIFAFDRPGYLKELLKSLETNAGLEDIDFYCFQDGSINKFSGKLIGNEENIQECLELWANATLPNKQLIRNESNLGIAINYWEAATLLFDNLQYDQVMFFEDDLIVNRYYIRSLRLLLEQFKNETSVGIVTCHGGTPRKYSEEEKSEKLRQIRPGGYHLWGYGIWRDRWQKMKSPLSEYYQLVSNGDGSPNRRQNILDLYANNGVNIKATSHDGAIYYSLVQNRLVCLSTVLHRGQYIGAEGIHMRPKQFAELGYADMELFEDDRDGQITQFEGYDEQKALEHFEKAFRLKTP